MTLQKPQPERDYSATEVVIKGRSPWTRKYNP